MQLQHRQELERRLEALQLQHRQEPKRRLEALQLQHQWESANRVQPVDAESQRRGSPLSRHCRGGTGCHQHQRLLLSCRRQCQEGPSSRQLQVSPLTRRSQWQGGPSSRQLQGSPLSHRSQCQGGLAVACLRSCYPTASAQWNLVVASVEGRCRDAAYPKGRLAATTNCPKGRRDSPDPAGQRLAGCPKGSVHRRCGGGPQSRRPTPDLPPWSGSDVPGGKEGGIVRSHPLDAGYCNGKL